MNQLFKYESPKQLNCLLIAEPWIVCKINRQFRFSLKLEIVRKKVSEMNALTLLPQIFIECQEPQGHCLYCSTIVHKASPHSHALSQFHKSPASVMNEAGHWKVIFLFYIISLALSTGRLFQFVIRTETLTHEFLRSNFLLFTERIRA